MNEEYLLVELNSSWATFKPDRTEYSLPDRQFTLSQKVWVDSGKPLSLLVAVESLVPFKEANPT